MTGRWISFIFRFWRWSQLTMTPSSSTWWRTQIKLCLCRLILRRISKNTREWTWSCGFRQPKKMHISLSMRWLHLSRIKNRKSISNQNMSSILKHHKNSMLVAFLEGAIALLSSSSKDSQVELMLCLNLWGNWSFLKTGWMIGLGMSTNFLVNVWETNKIRFGKTKILFFVHKM